MVAAELEDYGPIEYELPTKINIARSQSNTVDQARGYHSLMSYYKMESDIIRHESNEYWSLVWLNILVF